MTTQQERMTLLGYLSSQAKIKEKSARLTKLVGLIPEFQATHDRVKETKVLWEKQLSEREDVLLALAEGKNAEARRASMLEAKGTDPEYQQILNTLNGIRGELIQASLERERLEREWQALTIQIHVFTSTLKFLAEA